MATGVASLLEERDRVAATYRGHGHALALGVDPQKLLDEMLARETGINGGRAGSMNVTSPADRLIGSFGIVGGSIAAATGAALALKKTTGGVAVAYFGDGTMNQAYVFECLNFCQVLKLPLVFMCENNGYGEYTPFRVGDRGRDPGPRRGLRPSRPRRSTAMSVWTVREAAARAIAHARDGNGPAFVEALTYRFVGHSRSDPGRLPARGRARRVEDARSDHDPPRAARGGGRRGRAPGRARAGGHGRAGADARAGPRSAVPERAPSQRVQGLTLVSSELTMPKLSDSMADAVILRWLKSPGDAFAKGEALIEVETDKATVVYEAEADGTLGSILVPEGETASIGEPIATLANGDGAAPAAADSERANATPVARRTAVELGVSLHGIVGTGAAGRITREDVERVAAESGAAAPEPTAAPEPASGGKGDVQVLELTPTQATIARRMVESATTIPSFTVSADIDMSLITALRREARGENQDVPSINDFVVKAAAAALKEFPRFNASYVDGKVECYSRVNVGVAVATEDALLVPVVQDAGEKTLAQIAQETKRLAEAARSRSLAPEDLHDGTFTVSNLGMFGVRSFEAIIDPPQVAILAVGGARREPVEDDHGGVAFRDLMTVTLTCDHRVVYGADGARFLSRLRELLERPLALTL